MSKKRGFVPTSFRDRGTGEFFEGGKEHEFDAGAHANYTAAGKIGPKPDAKADDKAAK